LSSSPLDLAIKVIEVRLTITLIYFQSFVYNYSFTVIQIKLIHNWN